MMPAAPLLAAGHAPTAAAPVDINGAIVRFVAQHQPCAFKELAELFVEPTPSGVVNAGHLLVLQQRLRPLCASGRLARTAPVRRSAAGRRMRPGRYIVAASALPAF